MNLLGRIWHSIGIFIAMPVMYSCVDPVDVGVELDPDGIKLDVIFEEIWLPTTNILIDSVRTNNRPLILAGKYSDPVFGTTEAVGYTQITTIGPFAIRNDTVPPLNEYIFDSLTLDLRIATYHSDRIGETQEIFIHQLEDSLFSNVFYLKDFTTPLSAAPIAQTSFNYIPDRDTLLHFTLPNQLGQDMLDILENTSLNGNINIPALINGVRGIGIRGGENNSALIGFDPNHAETKLTLYYQIENERDSLFMDLQLNNVTRYHSSTTDRSGSLMSVATTNFGEFDTGDGRVYVQPGSGIFPKLDLTPLNDFLINRDNIVINSAEIEIGGARDFILPDYVDFTQNFRYAFIKDNENVDAEGINSTNRLNALILTNGAYLSGFSEQLVSTADTVDRTFLGDITLFSQLINTGDLEVENIALLPTDNASFNQGALYKDSVRVRVFYTVPK